MAMSSSEELALRWVVGLHAWLFCVGSKQGEGVLSTVNRQLSTVIPSSMAQSLSLQAEGVKVCNTGWFSVFAFAFPFALLHQAIPEHTKDDDTPMMRLARRSGVL